MIKQKDESLIQNLKDAGCEACMITDFMANMDRGKIAEGIKLLQNHRAFLLMNIHKGQKQIDCLDYLIYQMKKYA